MYFMLPAIAIALAVGYGVAVSYRTRRTYVVVLIWLAIIVLAALTGHWAMQASSWAFGSRAPALGLGAACAGLCRLFIPDFSFRHSALGIEHSALGISNDLIPFSPNPHPALRTSARLDRHP